MKVKFRHIFLLILIFLVLFSTLFVDGVVNVLRQATAIFEKMGVTEIPAKGEKFDPNVHNAVMHEDNPDIGENTITDVFLKGYILGDKVIRHSVVKVAN